MEFVLPDFRLATPEIFIACAALFVLMVTSFKKQGARTAAFWLCEITLLGAFVLILGSGDVQRSLTFGGMYIADLFGSFLKLVVCLAVAIVLQYGRAYMAARKIDTPEYYLMVLFATLGMFVLISASHFVSIYMGLELMSLSLYGLVASDRDNPRSTEAGMKYFVLGALASGLLLYGMSMLYGATGSLELHEIAQRIYDRSANDVVVAFGLVFVMVGVAFKLGVVPFHMWVPDVYHGAPTAVTLLVSSAPKIAAFAMAFRILVLGLFDLAEQWQQMLMLLAVASIVLGNLAAVAQTNIKRMLAYSGISHMGFMLLGLLAGVVKGEGGTYAINAYSSAMFYTVAYVLMTLASFGMVILLSRAGFEAENVDDFKGLNQRSPWFAGMMLIVMFSMAGIPFFVGFFAKLSVLQAVVAAGNVSGLSIYYWLAGVAVVMSAIGAFYYLRVVKVMYFDDALDNSPIEASIGTRSVLSANALLLAVIGLLPNSLMQICAFTLLH
ncbi:NADH-quinone oxidoreductase subunit NuoN [Niveibacterium umoris]|uniref:NADH-quinone oxidoreductase subunit N n=1 Tax=Niveibacterium umoris TaxID=1193620 RepID=A0A840BKE1_9RHOO|nr:NADH-quinone oxidoreductase subunit NuoN [Niveibacterium umoris]MBB4012048.1 NADH-quinone oxidoreductase subunit N [Niveibacterium umoris]